MVIEQISENIDEFVDDSTIKVDSDCEWRGTKKEPQWDNIKRSH